MVCSHQHHAGHPFVPGGVIAVSNRARAAEGTDAVLRVCHVAPGDVTPEPLADTLRSVACRRVEVVGGDPGDATDADCLLVDDAAGVDPGRLSAHPAPVVLHASPDRRVSGDLLEAADTVVRKHCENARRRFYCERVCGLVTDADPGNDTLAAAMSEVEGALGGESAYFVVAGDGSVEWSSASLGSVFPSSAVDAADATGFDERLTAAVESVPGADRYVGRESGADGVARYLTLRAESGTRHYRLETHHLDALGDGRRLEVVRDVTGTVESTDRLRTFRSLAEDAQDGLYALDETGTIEFCNESFADMLGYEPEELVGEHARALSADGEFERAREAVERLLTEPDRESCKLDAVCEHRDGHLVDVSFHFTLQWSRDDVLDGIVAVARDVTERRERERRLERYETLVNAATDPMFAVGPDGRFTLVNDAFLETTGLDRETVVGASPSVLVEEGVVRPEVIETWRDVYGDLVDSERREREYEFELEANFEERRIYEGRIVQFDVDDGSSLNIFRDITERKERERELERANSRYETLVNNYPDGGVFLFDDDLTYTLAGGNGLERMGLTADDFEGATPHDVLPDRIADELAEYYRSTLGDSRHSFEQSYRGIHYHVRTLPVRDDDGTVVSGMAVAQDVTERKERERTLRRERDKLARLETVVTSIQPLTETLTEAATREDLEAELCARLEDSEAYTGAWVGGLRSYEDRLHPRAAAGLPDDYFGDPALATDGESALSRAVRSGDPQVLDGCDADAGRPAGGGSEADSRSVVVVPLTHRSTTHGVLAVQHADPDAFTDRELSVLSGLGRRVGQAVTAIENRRLLRGDHAVELRFCETPPVTPLARTAESRECAIELQDVARVDEEKSLFHVAVEEGDAGAVADELAGVDGVELARALGDGHGTGRVQYRYRGSCPFAALIDHGGVVRSARFTPSGTTLVADVAPGSDVGSVVEAVKGVCPEFEVVSKCEREGSTDPPAGADSPRLRERLTERQREVVTAAYHAGYYDWPRETDAEELADALDVSSPTLHEHLRKVHARLADAVVEETAVSAPPT